MQGKLKPYSKPQVVRYGSIEDLTQAGNPGGRMDALAMTAKTGF